MKSNNIINKTNFRFNEYDNYAFEKKEGLIDEGKANIGYTLTESLEEAIDDSLDAGGHNICGKLFSEFFVEYKEHTKDNNSDASMTSNRGSYIVSDDGVGIKNIEEVFNFGESKNVRYDTKKDYLLKNGRFRYGFISHFNVGSQVILYSKTKDDENWKYIIGNYNRHTSSLYVSKPKYATNEDKTMLEEMGVSFSKPTGTILYVRGVQKTEFDFTNANNFIEELIRQIGMTYYDYLCGNYTITVNNNNVFPLNPLGEDLVDELIKPSIFAKYEISLNEILTKLNDNIIKEGLISRFLNIFDSKEQLLNETIKIKLVSINKNLGAKSRNPKLDKIYFPTVEYRGFYIKRNKRYIGKALSMLGIVLDHSKYNRFRGEISFNPIFDGFFKIQINKNENTLSGILISLIGERILNDVNLQGNTAATRIENALKSDKNITDISKNMIENKIKNLKKKARESNANLNISYQDTREIEEIINLLNRKDLEENDIEDIGQRLVQIDTEFFKRNREIYEDVSSLINRIYENKKRKSLKHINEELNYVYLFSALREPIQEGELYGVFYLIYTLYPDKFDFDLIDYNTTDGIDCIIKINSKMFEKLNLKKRFGKQMDRIKEELEIADEFDNQDEKKFCYLELKIKLADTINHSLALVSHIICWSKSKSDQIQAYDDLYSFTDSNKTLLINSNNEITKKVKVIYLKNVIENITGGKFYR